METDRLLNGASEDYGSGSGSERGGAPGGRRMSYCAAGDSCSVDRDPGERMRVLGVFGSDSRWSGCGYR